MPGKSKAPRQPRPSTAGGRIYARTEQLDGRYASIDGVDLRARDLDRIAAWCSKAAAWMRAGTSKAAPRAQAVARKESRRIP